MPQEYLSLEEVADQLGVTYQLIYKLVRSGELPAIRLGKLYRVAQNDLDAYLGSRKVTPMERGGVCSVCGKHYNSDLSLTQCCTEPGCEAAICDDCWIRGKHRFCNEHEPRK